jgi:hypothetical protein
LGKVLGDGILEFGYLNTHMCCGFGHAGHGKSSHI